MIMTCQGGEGWNTGIERRFRMASDADG
jgi:hypothetical protein